MKHLKMFGLAATAAVALMAVVGAGTAAAKVCSSTGTGAACGGGHGNEYKGQVTAKTTEAKLTTGLLNITCASEIVNTVTNSSTGTGSISEISFTGCIDSEGRACTVATTGRPYHSVMEAIAAPSGTLTTTVAVEFTCKNPFNPAENVNCKYHVSAATPTVIGGALAPRIVTTGVKLNKGAGSHAACSAQLTWDGEYSITAPATLFLT